MEEEKKCPVKTDLNNNLSDKDKIVLIDKKPKSESFLINKNLDLLKKEELNSFTHSNILCKNVNKTINLIEEKIDKEKNLFEKKNYDSQRKFSLHQQQTNSDTKLPNFMGLFLADDQQLIFEKKSNKTEVPSKNVFISQYLQKKSFKNMNQQINSSTSSIINLPNNTNSKKKFSEPFLNGLLREEFFFTLNNNLKRNESINNNAKSNSSTSSSFNSANSSSTNSVANSIASFSGNFCQNSNYLPDSIDSLTESSINNLENLDKRFSMTSCKNSNIYFNLKAKTNTKQTFGLNNENSNTNNQLNILQYLPFKRFSKRAQSDPWISDKFTNRFLYTGNRRFTLDSPAEKLYQKDEEDKRTLAVTEVYNTEKSYVESLKILVNNYMQPLKTSNLVERNLVDEIFYQIPEILKHHEHFLMLLQARLDNWDVNQNIGDVFREIFTRQPIIDTYIAFINNWKNANEAIRSACQVKPNFLKFLELKSREQKNKYSLDDYLIMPVQRIPRYELLIKDLLKYTNVEHSDYKLLKLAQQDIHEIAVNINNIEKETAQVEKDMQQLKEIEMCIEGTIDLVQPNRKFVHYENAIVYDSVQNVKKDRYLFLFNDLLIVTSLKKKTTANKKISSSKSNSPFNTLDGNKHKCVQKFLIKNIFIAKKNEQTFKKNKKEIEILKEDQEILNRIIELTKNLNCNHLQLDEQLNSVRNSVNKHLMEKNNQENFLSSLDLFVQTTPDTFETYELIFNNVERKTIFETKFNQLKKLLSGNDTITPYFLREIALPKTRAGLLFSCATATLPFKINSIENTLSNLDNYSHSEKNSKNSNSKNSFNSTINQQINLSNNLTLSQNSNIVNTFKQNSLSENDQYGLDVWICNSDGYVGQVCVLSLNTEPTVTSCNGVCNSRILCIVAVPAYRQSLLTKEFENISSLKNEDSYDKSQNELKRLNETKILFEKSVNLEINQNLNKEDKILENDQPTMWLGTEDKMIHIYNCNDNIRMKKNKIKISLCSSVNTIVYLDCKVYAGLNSGELVIFSRDETGKWLTNDFLKLQINNKPIVKIIACHEFLWIAYGNEVAIYETEKYVKYLNTIKVSTDNSKTIQCMTNSDYSIWIATTRSSQVRLYHATSMQFLLEINVSATVNRLLNVLNDNIIKQHKSACLRVTTLLACKQTLWIGTTAGIVCTLTTPSVDELTQQVPSSIKINNVSHGHTGHVRFLTAIELNSASSEFNLSKFTGSNNTTQQQQLEKQLIKGQNYLIISGGDGFENFSLLSNNNSNEGKGDSTNHLLLWVV